LEYIIGFGMKKYFVPFVVFICLSSFYANSLGSYGVLKAGRLHPFGRTLMNDGRLELIGSASHFGYSFEGESSEISVETGGDSSYPNYLQYEVNGEYREKVRIRGGAKVVVHVEAGRKGRNDVWVYKATEANTGPIFISAVSGWGLKSLERPHAPLIEFIGNSITCGALSDPSGVPCGKGVYQDQHNAYFAYGPRVARALKANFILSSVSGIGIYRNWNSDGPTMPQVYEKADFQFAGLRMWDFSLFTPDVVSIALGTNDYSNGDGVRVRTGFDSTAFVGHYVDFVKLVKSKYPGARIALLSSPMVSGDKREQFQRCLMAVQASIDRAFPADKPVAVHFAAAMTPHGCSFHPSVEDHGVIAEELVPFFKELIQ
jgi:hypothetical protein